MINVMEKSYKVIKAGRTLTIYDTEHDAKVYARKVKGYTKEQQTNYRIEIPEITENCFC
jgi:hypothetical protein